MSVMNRLILAVAVCATAFSAVAEERTAVAADPARAVNVAAAQAGQLQLRKDATIQTQAVDSTNAVAATRPGQPITNLVRAYPPSCLADPLPDTASGPLYSNSNVSLAAFNRATSSYVQEPVTITIWRVACSSPLTGLQNAATLMRVQRRAQYEGDIQIYPLFPATRVKQGTITYADSSYPKNLVRVASEPNTVVSDTLVDAPIIYSATYVLENYQSNNAGYFDFNAAFGIRFDNQFNTGNLFTIDVPDYNPTQGTYPDAFLNLPISGYLGTNYYDPAHSGEGMLFQIFENESDRNGLNLSLAWFTFDTNGIPFWLFSNARIERGARSVTMPIGYRTGGTFAGGGTGGTAGQTLWGTITVAFPSCNDLRFTYASTAGLPAGVPTGNGTRNWKRVANVNGLPCE